MTMRRKSWPVLSPGYIPIAPVASNWWQQLTWVDEDWVYNRIIYCSHISTINFCVLKLRNEMQPLTCFLYNLSIQLLKFKLTLSSMPRRVNVDTLSISSQSTVILGITGRDLLKQTIITFFILLTFIFMEFILDPLMAVSTASSRELPWIEFYT